MTLVLVAWEQQKLECCYTLCVCVCVCVSLSQLAKKNLKIDWGFDNSIRATSASWAQIARFVLKRFVFVCKKSVVFCWWSWQIMQKQSESVRLCFLSLCFCVATNQRHKSVRRTKNNIDWDVEQASKVYKHTHTHNQLTCRFDNLISLLANLIKINITAAAAAAYRL